MSEPNPKRILVILAHPDDESFAVGGTLAKYAHQGAQIILLCATRGEAGIAGVEPKKAGDIRERELRIAAQHLGIEVYFMGYPDGGLANTEPGMLLETITCWIGMVQPQLIITFGPEGGSGHPDHLIISKVVTQAYDQCCQKGLLLYIRPSEATVLGCGVSSSRTEDRQPLVEIDISDYKLDKIRAIQSHASQNPGLPARPEEEVENIPCSELFSIARGTKTTENYPDWFEMEREEEINGIREQASSVVPLHR